MDYHKTSCWALIATGISMAVFWMLIPSFETPKPSPSQGFLIICTTIGASLLVVRGIVELEKVDKKNHFQTQTKLAYVIQTNHEKIALVEYDYSQEYILNLDDIPNGVLLDPGEFVELEVSTHPFRGKEVHNCNKISRDV